MDAAGSSTTAESRRIARIALAVLLGSAVLVGLVFWRGRETAPEGLWFDQLVGVRPPADEELVAVVEWLAAAVLGNGGAAPPPTDDFSPRILFLTLSDGERRAEVVLAKGEGLLAAAERALALAGSRSADRAPRWLKVDVVDHVAAAQEVGEREAMELERGLDGIALAAASRLAFLPEEVVTNTLVNSDREMRATNVEEYARVTGRASTREVERLWRGDEAVVLPFTTRSWFADSGGLFALYRGHRALSRIRQDELLPAARAAGEYLRGAVKDDGSFVYSYLPKTDREKDDYNMLRHAGTAYSMLELFEVTGDAELLAAAERALSFLRRQIVDCGDSAAGSCVAEDGYVKLGGNALAILAFAKHAEVTGDRAELPLLVRLARWMTGVQSESGEFTIHKQHLETGRIDDHVSQYYPGEALFALVRLNALDGDPEWLDAAQRGAEYLIEVRDGDLADEDLSHDHWLLYALNELHGKRPQALWVDHSLRLARVIAASQNRDPAFPDWRGSYYRPPRSTPTATRSEGLRRLLAGAARRPRRGGGRHPRRGAPRGRLPASTAVSSRVCALPASASPCPGRLSAQPDQLRDSH